MDNENEEEMQEMLKDPAIKDMKARYYPAPERWEIQKGCPVRKLVDKVNQAGNSYEELEDTNIPRPVWVEGIIRNIIDGSVNYLVGFELIWVSYCSVYWLVQSSSIPNSSSKAFGQ